MKKLMLILTICTLSGCGLFRKTTKVNKQLDAVSVSTDVKVSTETTEGRIDKSKEQVTTAAEGEDKVTVYPTKGTDVKVSPDGSVTFKADSIVSYTKHKTRQAREILKDIKEDLQQKVANVASRDSTDRRQREAKEIDKQPSAAGIFSNWIDWGLGFLIVVCGVIWFLRRK